MGRGAGPFGARRRCSMPPCRSSRGSLVPWESREAMVGIGSAADSERAGRSNAASAALFFVASIAAVILAWYGLIWLFHLDNFFAKTPLDVWSLPRHRTRRRRASRPDFRSNGDHAGRRGNRLCRRHRRRARRGRRHGDASRRRAGGDADRDRAALDPDRRHGAAHRARLRARPGRRDGRGGAGHLLPDSGPRDRRTSLGASASLRRDHRLRRLALHRHAKGADALRASGAVRRRADRGARCDRRRDARGVAGDRLRRRQPARSLLRGVEVQRSMGRERRHRDCLGDVLCRARHDPGACRSPLWDDRAA